MSDEEITEVATVKVSIKDGKMRELKAAMVARSCEDMEPLRMAIERGREAGLERSEIDNAVRILHDLELRTQAVAFTDVPRSDILKLQACGSRDEIVDSLKTLMKLKDKDGFRAEVLAEFHFQNFVFCQKQGYGPEKASALLSMMRILHSQTVVGKKDIEEAKSLLEDLLARHSRQLPPFSVGIFSQAEVASIRDYATRTFLRHFKMFQFIYQQCKDLRIRTIESRVTARVPSPAPLHTDFELNPHEVPQLQEFLRSEASEEVVDSKEEGAGVEAADRRRVPQSAAEAKVAEVMDEVLKNHLGDLESRMALPT